MKKTLSIAFGIILVILIGALTLTGTPDDAATSWTGISSNVSLQNGVQYVVINARGGYSPRTSTIQPGIPTKLVMKTNNTYDCSSALVIRSVGYRSMLPPDGETIIDLGTPKTGSKIQGLCSMGMYSFTLNVS